MPRSLGNGGVRASVCKQECDRTLTHGRNCASPSAWGVGVGCVRVCVCVCVCESN